MSATFTEDEKRDAARWLIKQHLESFEFCSIYEDEDYCELPDEEQRELLDLVNSAKVTITWKDA